MRINTLVRIALLIVAIGLPLRANLMCLPILPPDGTPIPNIDDTCSADHNGTNPIGTFVTSNNHGATYGAGPGVSVAANVVEEVYREAGGTLDFYIQMDLSTRGVPTGVTWAFTSDFSNYITEVGTVSPIQLPGLGPGTVAPNYDVHSADGSLIIFYFTNGIPSGSSTLTMAISTNATQIGPGVIGLEDPNVLIPAVPGFSPGGPVAGTPEPASIALLGCATGLSALLIRRKRG